MKIVSSFHPSSSVLGSVKCRLGSGDLEYLVVTKLDKVEVYSLRSHGLQKECVLPVWGKICSVKAIPISSEDTQSKIAIMITHPEPELLLLQFKEATDTPANLSVEKQISLFERLPRIAEFFTDFVVHPSGECIAVSCYASKLKIIHMENGKYAGEFDAALPETNLFSLAFLPTTELSLAVLFLDTQGKLQLTARDVNIENSDVSIQLSFLLRPTNVPDKIVPFPTDVRLHLIPIPPQDGLPLGGILIAGGRQLVFYELSSDETQLKEQSKKRRLESKFKDSEQGHVSNNGFKKRKPTFQVEWPWNEISTWSNIENGSSILIADIFGRLAMISLGNVMEMGIILIPLGEVSPPTTLTYLTSQFVYVGSHLGDSQLIQITDAPSSTLEDSICAIPADIKTISSGSLTTISHKGKGKGKGKAVSNNDMDVDEESTTAHTKGQVLKFEGPHINVIESFKNIAPIMDAIAVDIDASGQVQLVTCSGGANTGSLNIVRNGSEYAEQAFLQGLTDITGIWPVRAQYDDQNTSYIVISTLTETHLFHVNDSGGNNINLQREECGLPGGFVTDKPTITLSNFSKRENAKYVNSSVIVQVVSDAAYLLEWDTSLKMYMERDSWKTANNKAAEIVAASANGSQLIVAQSGGKISVFCISDNAVTFRKLAEHQSTRSEEVSALSLMPVNTYLPFSRLVTVAYWQTNVVEIFTIFDQELHSSPATRSPPLPAVVRSLRLFNFGSDSSSKGEDYHVFLLAGLGDGSVATMHWKDGGLHDLKIVSLGHAPVNLTPCEVDGKKSIFAAGNRSTLFSFDKNRLVNSPIALKEITAASRINTRSFTSSLVLATPSGLSIGFVRNLNKMHIRSVMFGLDNPRKLIHSPILKAFGVSCTSIQPVRIGDFEPLTSSFHLVDDTNLTRLAQYKCSENEEISAVLAFTANVNGEERPFFCLGTLKYKEEEIEASSGRLIILGTESVNSASNVTTTEFRVMATADVTGCVYALKSVEGMIVASINSSISLWKFNESENSSPPLFSLKKLSEWNHSYIISTLGSLNNRIAAGDQISSVSLLSVENNKLVTTARDYGPLYPLAVELIDESTIITSNDSLNIVMFKLEKSGSRDVLERIGVFHLGDMISKFFRGSLTGNDQGKKADLDTETIFFTTSGRIGVVIDVRDKDLALHLSELQRNMSAAIPAVGGVSHTRFRAPKDTRGSTDAEGAAFGFLDGDFLEQFPALGEDTRKKIMNGRSEPEKLKMSEHDIFKTLEQLQALH